MKKLFTLLFLTVSAVYFVHAQVPVNNECSGALDITSALGQPVGQITTLGPYDNTNATTEPSDPTTGFECFGEPTGNSANPSLEKTLWFSFVGDGGTYYIRTNNCAGVTDYIDYGDTQIAIYTGTCGTLTPYVCNEDGPQATSNPPHYPAGLNVPTSPGVTYYMMIDGFLFTPTTGPSELSDGEFCVFVSQIATVACNDPSLSTGTATINNDTICPGDTLRVDIIGVEAPTVGLYNGLSWVVSSANLNNSNDPLSDPSVFVVYGIQSPAPDTSFRLLVNDGQFIGTVNNPYGTYYMTPVIFGNAAPNVPNPVFLNDVTLDPSCTQTGNSIQFTFLAPGDPLCIVGITSIDASGYGILNIYPNPVRDQLSVNISIKGNEEVKLSVIDQLGKELVTNSLMINGEGTAIISTESLAKGIYFVKMESGTNLQYVRFMKQ